MRLYCIYISNFRINFNTDPTSDFLFQLSPRRSDGNYYSPIVREGKNFWGTPVNEFTADGSVCAGGGACWFKLVDLNGNDVHRDTLRYGVPYKLQYTDAEMGNGTAGAVWRTVGLNGVSPAEWRANGSDDMIIMLFNNQGNL